MALHSNRLTAFTGGFAQSAGVLVGGTAAAQALALLALPLLTRLYSPEEFSLLAVYAALVTIITAIACLRLEIAIPLPKADGKAANLLALSLTATIGMSVIVAAGVYLFGGALASGIGQPELATHLWLAPIGTLFAGWYAAFQYWSTRTKQFPVVARTRIMQVCTGVLAQLGLGWSGYGPIGLMVGHALMTGSGVLPLFRNSWRLDKATFSTVSRSGMRDAFSLYQRFPRYSTFEALANNAAIELPVILIAYFAIGPEAGFLLLATRAIGTPVNIIGNAVGQVYLSRAPEALRDGTLPQLTASVTRGLLTVSVIPLILIAFFAPAAFSFVFGEEWRRAGELVTWMVPWFALKLLASPLSMVMHVRMLQREMLVLTVFGLVLRVGMVAAAHWHLGGLETEAYAVSGFLFYVVALTVFSRAAGIFRGITQ